MEHEPPEPEMPHAMGEDSGTDMRRPLARIVNKKLRSIRGTDTVIDLGEHGEVDVNHVRFRDAKEAGKLKAYIRQEASDPKVIVPVVVALGVVAAGIYNLKYRKK
jgi:hypothetical protein